MAQASTSTVHTLFNYLVMNSLSFHFSEDVSLSWSVLKGIFAGYRNLTISFTKDIVSLLWVLLSLMRFQHSFVIFIRMYMYFFPPAALTMFCVQ